jgi:hypothetical protein
MQDRQVRDREARAPPRQHFFEFFGRLAVFENENVSQRLRVTASASERGAADRLSMSFVNVAISRMDASPFINSSKSRAACRARPFRVEL